MYYGISTEVGYEQFDVISVDNFEESSQDEVPYSVSAFLGVSPNNKALYLGAGFNYSVQFDDAQSQTICPAGQAETSTICQTGSFADPVRDRNASLFGLARYQTNLSLFNTDLPVGAEVRFAYDFEDNTFGITAPIYLFTNSDNRLTGGIQVSWDDDDSNVDLGVFVTRQFNLFGE